jgi:hypothetical protein
LGTATNSKHKSTLLDEMIYIAKETIRRLVASISSCFRMMAVQKDTLQLVLYSSKMGGCRISANAANICCREFTYQSGSCWIPITASQTVAPIDNT